MTTLKMLLQRVVLLAVMHLACVGADYTFEARLESYQNPTHSMEPDGSCCDGGVNAMGACTDSCDNTFIFCIQESNSTENNLGRPDACPFLRHDSRVFQNNDDITFRMDEDLGDGVSNPLTFSGSGIWPGGVRFLVRARDSDPGMSLTIIGTLVPVVDISAGSDFTTMTFMSTAFLTMTVSFRVMCTGNSMGPDCSICREGFQSPASGCTETCTPAQGCSPVGGFCNAADVCVCREGYSGDNCDIDLDPCVPATPCQNGGTCTTTGPGQFECQCVEGYEGDSCELMVTDECDSNPCQNGGTCTDRFQDFECECVEGYEGDTCGDETDECDPNPCQNGGTCNDLLADFNCSCASGFSGRNCEEEEEASSLSGAVIGGAVAAVVLLVVIVVLVLVLVLVLMKQQSHKKMAITDPGTATPVKALSGDNPVYAGEVGTFAKMDTQNTNTGSSVHHDFKNPLYDTPVDKEYDTLNDTAPGAKTLPQALYSTLEEQGAPPTHEYDYATNETTPPKAPTKPSAPYDYADGPKPPALPVYDSADDPTTKLPSHTYSHPHASKTDVPPIHEYDYAGTGQPVYATPGDPPVVNEHYEMMPTDGDASKGLDPTEHYEFGPDF